MRMVSTMKATRERGRPPQSWIAGELKDGKFTGSFTEDCQ